MMINVFLSFPSRVLLSLPLSLLRESLSLSVNEPSFWRGSIFWCQRVIGHFDVGMRGKEVLEQDKEEKEEKDEEKKEAMLTNAFFDDVERNPRTFFVRVKPASFDPLLDQRRRTFSYK
jgi:hypothetical protein